MGSRLSGRKECPAKYPEMGGLDFCPPPPVRFRHGLLPPRNGGWPRRIGSARTATLAWAAECLFPLGDGGWRSEYVSPQQPVKCCDGRARCATLQCDLAASVRSIGRQPVVGSQESRATFVAVLQLRDHPAAELGCVSPRSTATVQHADCRAEALQHACCGSEHPVPTWISCRVQLGWQSGVRARSASDRVCLQRANVYAAGTNRITTIPIPVGQSSGIRSTSSSWSFST